MTKVQTSRILPPSLPEMIDRPRLIRRLQENVDHRLICILGQAAQGKSTLAARFIQTSSMNHAWINLIAEDDNPVNLFYATTASMSSFLDAGDVEFLMQYPGSQLGPRDQKALFQDWTRTMFNHLHAPTRFIYDGLERLPDTSPSFAFLQVLLQEAPEQITFILISRREPPLPLHEWKMKQRAFVLSNTDMAFTYKETRSFLREHCGLRCEREQVKKVWQSTEGWAGGLVLLAQVLEHSDRPDLELKPIDGLPDRFQAEVFFYFAKEIFANLSENEAWILLHSSVFEEVRPDFVDALLGIEGSETLLKELARRNLFVSAVYDAGKGWIYRYHQLFRDFLQQLRQDRFDPQVQKAFQHRTAKAFVREKNFESALDFFLKAEEFFLAASVLRVLGRELIRSGRHRDLAGFLLRFPERIIRKKPWLMLYRALCRQYSHAAENVRDLQKIEAMFRTRQDICGLLLTLGSLMEALMLLGRDIVPVHTLLAKGEQLLSELESSKFSREQAHLWLQMGFCYSLRGKNTRDGFRASQNASMLARTMHDRPLQIKALIYSIIPLTFLGEFHEARRIGSRVERMLQNGQHPELEALFLKAWSELTLFGGQRDLELARGQIDQLQSRIEQLGLLFLQAPAMYSEFAFHIYAGNLEKAEAVGQTLQQMSRDIENSYGKGFCCILQGLLAYHRERWDIAGEHLEAGLEIFRQAATRSYLHDYEFSIGAGLVQMHEQNWQTAESLLLRSLQHFTGISSQLPRTEALLSLALLEEKQNRREAALEYLESGLSIAAAQDFTHFVIISPRDQLDVYVLALKAGSPAAGEYAARLLHAGISEFVEAEANRFRNHPHPGVRKTIQEVLLRRHRSSRPLVYIQSLGGFRVWAGDELLSEEVWEGNQAKGLLKALVALAWEKQIRKERLIEELWPESSPGAGEKTFKAALHRLRKSLEPDLSSRLGSTYIHLNAGCVFLDHELCQTDVHRFAALCETAKRLLKSGETKKGLGYCEEALPLYQGDFLPDDPDPEWARGTREALRQNSIALLIKAGRSCETQGTWTKAVRFYERVLGCDPCQEEVYRRIMALYADHGKRAKALQIYEQCRIMLRETLDIQPDSQTESLFRKIRR